MRNRFLLIIIFTFLSLNVFSQEYFIKSYNTQDGLATRLVYDICQDSSGIIWAATHDGISSYDGFNFKNYDRTDGLPEQHYKRVKLDEKGIIWCFPFYNNDTIIYFDKNSLNRFKILNIPDNTFMITDFAVMYIDEKPLLCVGGNNGIYMYKDELWQRFYYTDNSRDNYVNRVIAKGGKFYFATKSGIYIIENEKIDRSLNEKLTFTQDELLTIEFENTGKQNEKLWVLSYDRLGYFEDDNFRVYKSDLQLPTFYTNESGFIGFHERGRIIFGNNNSKYFISRDSDKMMPLMTSNGFSSNGAASLFIDREKNVWFADTRGVDKINKLSLVNYFVSSGLLDNDVTAITEVTESKFVFGHINGLTVLEKDNNFKRYKFEYDRTNSARVLDMIKDNDGNVWFSASGNGVGKMYPDGKIKWYKSENVKQFNSINKDIKGRIWVGTISEKNDIFIIKDNKLVKYEYSDNIINTNRKLYASDRGGMYVLGNNGVWYADDKGAKQIPSKIGNKINAYSYYKNKSGTEFVGTSTGLYFIDNRLLVKYNNNGIEISKPIYFIIQDKEGNYWLGSNDGVIKWNGEQNIELINTQNGLAGIETNRSAGIIDSEGRIWVGTDLGLSCFLPEYNKIPVSVPELKILDFEDSKGFKYNLYDENSISHNDNTLKFNFRGISYVNEESMLYKYKLDGYDKHWQEISQSMLDKVKYVNLNSGEYQFSVMVKNFSGEWSEVKTSGIIKINSPFYKSWWFLFLMLIIFGGMVASFVKIRDQKSQNVKLEKEIQIRKKTEQELIDSKRKYQDLIELLPETVYEIDIQGNIIFVNSYGLKMLNITSEELEKGINISEIIIPAEHAYLKENLNNILRNETLYNINYTCITKTGKRIPISVNAAPKIENGETVGIRGVAMDMTEHIQIQEALIKHAKELKDLNASKDKFFSIVAHDLKSPFQGLLGFSEFLYTDFDVLTEIERKEYIGHVRTSARNAHNLLDHLLQWSRLQTNRIEVIPQKLNLYSEVNSVIELLISNAIRKRISLINNVNKDIYIIADVNMLNSILQNLISNALKFTRQDGEVKIESETINGVVKVKIIDNGVGMDDVDIKKLFEIDQQYTRLGTMNEKGTGLGLLLCKEMIELNGGNISVESELGKGSKFIIELPRV
ncbi:MAG: ATP-binding protein [Ignavibacteria bacterium]